MSRYAKIKNDIVENIIICEDSQIGLLEGTYVKITDLTRQAAIGGQYDKISNKFIELQPYPSWILSDNLVWTSPVGNSPNDGDYEWDEESGAWNKLTSGKLQPTENHIWNPDLDEWILP